jgi:hypothetical protein
MMTPEIPVPVNIVEVDGFEQGSGNSTARGHAAVVRSPTYAALQEAMREREREREEGGGGWRPRRWWAVARWRRDHGSCVFSSSPGAPFI